jgi:hypothetical protein
MAAAIASGGLAGASGCQPYPETEDECPEACGANASCDPVGQRCFCDVGAFGDPTTECVPHGDLCADAEARVGNSVCRHEVSDETTWNLLSIGANNEAIRRGAKYLMPARADARLPTLVQDTNWYRFHYCVLARGFEPLFPGLTYADYVELVLDGGTREFYGGTISEVSRDDADAAQYVFTIETPGPETELLAPDEIYGVYRQLQDRFDVGELAYLPDSDVQRARADTFLDPPFPIATLPDAGGPQYEAYTPGLAYGRIRRFTDEELFGSGPLPFGWQDIIVVDNPPLSLEGVMAGAVTSARQDVLTHLNVLSAIRGTPNVRVADALEVFAPYDGQLVRLEARPTYYTIRAATAEEAQAHWAATRPSADLAARPDEAFEGLPALDEIAVGNPTERLVAVSRFGSKATGLATLRSVADTAHVVDGFAIPMSAYLAFMRDNTWEAPIATGTRTMSYAETITTWLSEDAFRTDAQLRASRLAALRDEMLVGGVVDPALVDELRAQIPAVFGESNVMVRLRSSSNAEDSLTFNGAGLYESKSACGPDLAGAGASACDPTDDAKPLDVSLKKVWGSLWNFGAFEEREYYQIDHRDVGMAVLVNPRFSAERANGVAFSGNPSDLDDPRFTINVQLGELDVVSASPGVVAELDRVRIEEGVVVGIDRDVASSETSPGEYVLDDDRVRELALLLHDVAAVYPIDGTPPEGTRVMLDVEFKITAAGVLTLKQVRPFSANPYDPGDDICP